MFDKAALAQFHDSCKVFYMTYQMNIQWEFLLNPSDWDTGPLKGVHNHENDKKRERPRRNSTWGNKKQKRGREEEEKAGGQVHHTLPYLRCSLKWPVLLWPHRMETQMAQWAQKENKTMSASSFGSKTSNAFCQLCVSSTTRHLEDKSQQRKEHAKLSCHTACLYCAALKSKLKQYSSTTIKISPLHSQHWSKSNSITKSYTPKVSTWSPTLVSALKGWLTGLICRF